MATMIIVNVDLRALLNIKKQMKQKQEIWDTLGQPSSKFNYMVKYSKPPTNNNHIPMSSTVSTGLRKKGMEVQVQSSNKEPFKGRSYQRLQSRSNFTNRRFSLFLCTKNELQTQKKER